MVKPHQAKALKKENILEDFRFQNVHKGAIGFSKISGTLHRPTNCSASTTVTYTSVRRPPLLRRAVTPLR